MAKALPVASVEQFSLDGDSTNLASRWDRWLKSFNYYVVGSGQNTEKSFVVTSSRSGSATNI